MHGIRESGSPRRPGPWSSEANRERNLAGGVWEGLCNGAQRNRLTSAWGLGEVFIDLLCAGHICSLVQGAVGLGNTQLYSRS